MYLYVLLYEIRSSYLALVISSSILLVGSGTVVHVHVYNVMQTYVHMLFVVR